MDTLITQLMEGLNISEEKAIEIITSITEYVENQHPVLSDLAKEISKAELGKIQNT
ncbi:MAG TPA: hypothetical protein VFZ78_02880 [Flavisolibacter sp.]